MNQQQIQALTTLEKQAIWFAGYFNRQAQRILEEPANDDQTQGE